MHGQWWGNKYIHQMRKNDELYNGKEIKTRYNVKYAFG